MNILVFTPWFPSEDKPHSGIFVQEISEALIESGAEVRVVHFTATHSDKFLRKNIKSSNHGTMQKYDFNLVSRFWRFIWHSPKLFLKLIRSHLDILIDEFKPDIVHCHVAFPCSVFANYVFKKYGIPFIITEHWSRIDGFLSEHPARSGVKRAYLQANRVIAVSDFLKDHLQDSIPSLSVNVIGNVVDENLFQYKPKPGYIDVIEFTAIASFSDQKHITKRPDLLVEALIQVQKEIDRSIHFELIGGGNKIRELHQLAMKLGLNVSIVGYKDKAYIKSRLQNTHFFLHASQIETFGIVCLEALLTGTPIVVSDVGALSQWVNERNGVLTKNDVQSWKEAILKAINTDYDHALISEEFKGQFGKKDIAKEYENIFKEVLRD